MRKKSKARKSLRPEAASRRRRMLSNQKKKTLNRTRSFQQALLFNSDLLDIHIRCAH
ncbi:hypothetical protein N9R79_08620 [Vibrio sp.]|nr:hypothetical protein [Vibrio sp.]